MNFDSNSGVKPENVVAFFDAVCEEVRELMAQLGFASSMIWLSARTCWKSLLLPNSASPFKARLLRFNSINCSGKPMRPGRCLASTRVSATNALGIVHWMIVLSMTPSTRFRAEQGCSQIQDQQHLSEQVELAFPASGYTTMGIRARLQVPSI